MTIQIKFLSLLLVLTASVGSVFAQSSELRMAKEAVKPAAANNVVMLEVNQAGISGVQFELRYDKNVRVSSVESCLAGIPDTHKGAFTACNHFPEKNTILVVVSDIGNSRPLVGPIGWIEFEAKRGVQSAAFQVAEMVALDTAGKSISETLNLVNLSVE